MLVDNGSTDPDALDLYRRLEKIDNVRIVPFARPFNFSAACNVGALGASGALLLFLNNDIEVIHADWLDELYAGHNVRKLVLSERSFSILTARFSTAGVVFGLGLVGHIFARARGGEIGLFGSPESYRNYLAVTGACQMMRREVFRQLGGFDERFRLSFSDVLILASRRGKRAIAWSTHRMRNSSIMSPTRGDARTSRRISSCSPAICGIRL